MKEPFLDIFHKTKSPGAYLIRPSVGAFIYYYIKAEHPHTIVELGSGQGRGTYWIAAAMEDDAIFHSIDSTIEWTNKAQQFCKKYNKKIHFVTCPTDETGWYLLPPEVPRVIDLLVVDGPSGGGLIRAKAYEHFQFKACITDDGKRDKSTFPNEFVLLSVDGGVGFFT